MTTYEIRDDSGWIEATLNLTEQEARDLEGQLPEGFCLVPLD